MHSRSVVPDKERFVVSFCLIYEGFAAVNEHFIKRPHIVFCFAALLESLSASHVGEGR